MEDRAISLNAVLAIAGDSCLDLDSYEDTKEFCDEIKELPPVTPSRPKGHWIKVYEAIGLYRWKCDKCKKHHRAMYDYCPSCGARMVEPQESEVKP